MGRKQDRKAAEGETNAVAELCKVQKICAGIVRSF